MPPPPPPPRPCLPKSASCNRPVARTCSCVAGVKDAVVDAVEELYLKAATGSIADPSQAALNLVTLAQGSSLGQSACLGPRPMLIVLLCAQQASPGITVRMIKVLCFTSCLADGKIETVSLPVFLCLLHAMLFLSLCSLACADAIIGVG